MIIHQLEIQNFKSYNGQHILGPLDSHFNCVIGPNGNGKSNIIDASAKLRQDSLASLIHKSAFATPDFATVSVVFKQNEEFTSVSRTIRKNGYTFYKINNQKIGWLQLREKLISKKIDLNKNLFIILQGEVQRLCELSPQMMVEYLQYVSGSDQFKQPIQASQSKYIQLSIQKQEIKLSQNIKKKMFDNSKEKASQQANWMIMRLKILLLQHLVFKKVFIDNHSIVERLKLDEVNQVESISIIQDQIKVKDVQIIKQQNQLKNMIKKINLIEQEIEKIQQKRQNVNLNCKQNQREINYISKDKQKKQQQKERYMQEVEELKKISCQHQQFINSNKKLKNQLDKFKDLAKLKLCLQFQQKISSIMIEQDQLYAKCKQNQINLDQDRQKLKKFQIKSKQNGEKKIQFKSDLKMLIDQQKSISQKLKETEQTITQIQRQLSQKPNQKIVTNLQKIQNQIRTANRLKLICSDFALTTLREQVIIDNNYSDVVCAILPQLDFFIVNTYAQAKQISDYLRKNKIGRMTFLIKQLINISVTQIKLVTNCPTQTKLIVDLCKALNQDTKNILIWALGNTLVTNNIDVAMKVAYYDQKKFRVITKNGQFIDTSGTMTKLNLKTGNDKENYQFLNKKLQTVKRLKNSITEKLSEICNIKQLIKQKKVQLQNEERSFDGLDEIFLEQLQKQIKLDGNKIKNNNNQLQILQENIDKLKTTLVKNGLNQKQYDKIMKILAEYLQNQAQVKKIESSNNLIQSLTDKIKQANELVSSLLIKMELKIKEKIRLDSQKMKYNQLIEDKQSEITSMQNDKSNKQEQINKLQLQLKVIVDQLGNENGRNSAGPKLRQQLKKMRTKIANIEYQQIEGSNKLFDSLKQIKQFANIINKIIFKKYPQLITVAQTKQNIMMDNNDAQNQQDHQNQLIKVLNQSTLYIGKLQNNFLQLLNKKQQEYLFDHIKSNRNIFININDVRPSDPKFDIIIEALPSKEIKFSHSFESEKLKHYQKELNRGTQNTGFEVNFQLFEQYHEKKKDYDFECDRLIKSQKILEQIKHQLIELRNKRMNIFVTSFNQINIELNLIYTKLTGGRAEINFIDSMNPFQGIQFSVRPVNKSWKRVNLLSGGEKTFTSLALIFACQQIKKFPFYFMDEIDAALDYKNTTLLAHYIKEKKQTQHIVISLRKNMYQQCNRIIGIYKVKDQSRTIQINMQELQKRQNTKEIKYQQCQ